MMNQNLRHNKAILRRFMRQHYSDDKLIELLSHMRDGRFAYCSCCCFVGAVTADHALRGRGVYYTVPHYIRARRLDGAPEAERAALWIVEHWQTYEDCDVIRRQLLIPMVKAEIRRRIAMKSAIEREAVVS